MQLSTPQQPTAANGRCEESGAEKENDTEIGGANLEDEEINMNTQVNLPCVAQYKGDFIGKTITATTKTTPYDKLLSLNEAELARLLHDPKAKQDMLKELLQATLQPLSHQPRRPVSHMKSNSIQQKPRIVRSEQEIEEEYHKIAEQLNMKQAKAVQMQQQQYATAKRFNERMDGYAGVSRSRKELAAGESHCKKMKECTFAPNIIGGEAHRGLGKFLSDQRRFNEKIRTNVERLASEARRKEMAMHQDQPKISERSKLLVKRQQQQHKATPTFPVYERLYSTRKPEKQPDPRPVHSGKGKSPERVQQLFAEAKCREDALEQKRKKVAARPRSAGKHLNDPYVIAKFDKEFSRCLEALGLPSKGNSWLDLNQMTNIMTDMGFIKEDCCESDQYTAILFRIFSILDRKRTGKIASVNLRTFVAAILNIAVMPDPSDCRLDPQSEVSDLSFPGNISPPPEKATTSYGEFSSETGVLVISLSTLQKIHSAFQLLYLTRKSYHEEKPRLRRTKTAEHPLFPGQLSQRHSSFVELTNELFQSKALQLEKISRMQYEKELEQQQQCTFSPQIIQQQQYSSTQSKSQKHSRNKSAIGATTDRCLELYSQAKKRRSRRHKSRDVQREEKELAECTLTPNLDKDQRLVRTEDAPHPMIDKSVERMRKAWAERERVRRLVERTAAGSTMKFGLNRNKHSKGTFAQFQSIAGQSRQRTLARSKTLTQNIDTREGGTAPKRVMLNIEVNMGDCQEWIAVHEGDTAAFLACEFSLKHHLDSDARATLESMIGAQIAKALDRIKEEDEEADKT